MSILEDLLEESIRYHNGVNPPPKESEDLWCVVIELNNTRHKSLIEETFGCNFTAPMCSSEFYMVGRCLDQGGANGIANHMTKVLDHLENQQLLLPFEPNWLPNYLSNHRLGINKIDVLRVNAPYFDQFMENQARRDAVLLRKQNAYEAFSNASMQDAVTDWAAHLRATYPELAELVSMTELRNGLEGIATLVTHHAIRKNKVLLPFLEKKCRAIFQKIKTHDASLAAVKSAGEESFEYLQYSEIKDRSDLSLDLLPEEMHLTSTMIDMFDRLLSQTRPNYYRHMDFGNPPFEFGLGLESTKDLVALTPPHRMVNVVDNVYRKKTLAHAFMRAFATHIYAIEAARYTKAVSEYIDTYAESINEHSVIDGFTQCLRRPLEDIQAEHNQGAKT